MGREPHDGTFSVSKWRVVAGPDGKPIAESLEYEHCGAACGACYKRAARAAKAKADTAATAGGKEAAAAAGAAGGGAAGAAALAAAGAGAVVVGSTALTLQGAVGRGPADAAEVAAAIAPELRRAVAQAVAGATAPPRRFAAGVVVSSVKDELKKEGLYDFTLHFAAAMEHVVRVLKMRKGLVEYTGKQSALEVVQLEVRVRCCYQPCACASHI